MENLIREEQGHWIFAHHVTDEEISEGWDDKWKIIEHMSKTVDFMKPIADSRRIGSTQEYAIQAFPNIELGNFFRPYHFENVDFQEVRNVAYITNLLAYGIPWKLAEYTHLNVPTAHIFAKQGMLHECVIDNEGQIFLLNYFVLKVILGVDRYFDSHVLFERKFPDDMNLMRKSNALLHRYTLLNTQKQVAHKVSSMEQTISDMKNHITEMEQKFDEMISLEKLKEVMTEEEYKYVMGEVNG